MGHRVVLLLTAAAAFRRSAASAPVSPCGDLLGAGLRGLDLDEDAATSGCRALISSSSRAMPALDLAGRQRVAGVDAEVHQHVGRAEVQRAHLVDRLDEGRAAGDADDVLDQLPGSPPRRSAGSWSRSRAAAPRRRGCSRSPSSPPRRPGASRACRGEDAERAPRARPRIAALSSKSTVKSAGSFDCAQRLQDRPPCRARGRTRARREPGRRPRRPSRSRCTEVVPADVAASGAGCGASAAPRRSRPRRRRRRAASRPRRPRSRAPCRGRTDAARRPAAPRAAGRRGAASGCRCRRSNAPPRRTSPTSRSPPRRRISSPRSPRCRSAPRRRPWSILGHARPPRPRLARVKQARRARHQGAVGERRESADDFQPVDEIARSMARSRADSTVPDPPLRSHPRPPASSPPPPPRQLHPAPARGRARPQARRPAADAAGSRASGSDVPAWPRRSTSRRAAPAPPARPRWRTWW